MKSLSYLTLKTICLETETKEQEYIQLMVNR